MNGKEPANEYTTNEYTTWTNGKHGGTLPADDQSSDLG